MAVVFIEKPNREGDSSAKDGSGKWEYVARVTGTATPELDLINAVIADSGYFWYNLSLKTISFQEQGNNLYSATVAWGTEVPNTAAQDPTASPGPTDGPGGGSPSGTPSGPASPDTPLGPDVQLEIGGRPPKLFLSRSVVFSEKAGGGAAVDLGKLLGLDDNGVAQGIEVDDPASVLTITKQFDYVTMGYIDFLQASVWSTNLSDWFHLKAGCVAFVGATLKTNAAGRVDASFKFGLKPQVTIAVGDLRNDAGANKLPSAGAVTQAGWDRAEFTYEDIPPAGGVNETVRKVKAMYVHEILPPIDFADFGIGE